MTISIACLLCPEDNEGYHPEFEGKTAGREFAAHLKEAHGLPKGARVQQTLSLRLKFESGSQSHYWLHELVDGQPGRRIGAQRVEVVKGGS